MMIFTGEVLKKQIDSYCIFMIYLISFCLPLTEEISNNLLTRLQLILKVFNVSTVEAKM